MRRLPVYLLLDTSGSMLGEPIEAVKMAWKCWFLHCAKIPMLWKLPFYQ